MSPPAAVTKMIDIVTNRNSPSNSLRHPMVAPPLKMQALDSGRRTKRAVDSDEVHAVGDVHVRATTIQLSSCCDEDASRNEVHQFRSLMLRQCKNMNCYMSRSFGSLRQNNLSSLVPTQKPLVGSSDLSTFHFVFTFRSHQCRMGFFDEHERHFVSFDN